MGFITFLGGAFGVLMLLFEEVAKTGRVPFRYYAMMVGLIRRPWLDRHWAGPAAAAADPWQGVTVTSRPFDFGSHEIAPVTHGLC
jgi:hypothetical protein